MQWMMYRSITNTCKSASILIHVTVHPIHPRVLSIYMTEKWIRTALLRKKKPVFLHLYFILTSSLISFNPDSKLHVDALCVQRAQLSMRTISDFYTLNWPWNSRWLPKCTNFCTHLFWVLRKIEIANLNEVEVLVGIHGFFCTKLILKLNATW